MFPRPYFLCMNSEEKDKEKNKKWELYGRASQKLPQCLRWICREYLYNDIPTELVEVNLEDTIRQLNDLERNLNQHGLETGFVARDKVVLEETDYGELRYFILDALDCSSRNVDRKKLAMKCPRYGQRNNSICWSCPVIAKVIRRIRK